MRTFIAALLTAPGLAACLNSDAIAPLAPCAVGQICVSATVKLIPIEGGCWAVLSDSGVVYEPATLPEGARVHGRRVHMVAVENKRLSSTCMVGTVVDVVSIEAIR